MNPFKSNYELGQVIMNTPDNNPLLMSPYEFNQVMKNSPIAYIPFGTVEWHGPHLPLGVDTLKIEAFTSKASSISGGIIFPALTWNRNTIRYVHGARYEGVEHLCQQELPGNIHFIREETFENLVQDCVACCIDRGFKAVCVWSGHNAAALAEYVPQLNSRLQEKYPDRRIYVSACDGGLVPQEQAREAGVDIIADHAGYWETSIIMATHPHLVHMDRVAGKDPDSLCVTNNDVLNASAEMGHKIIELCGSSMGTHMKKLLSEVVVEVPIPEPMPEAAL